LTFEVRILARAAADLREIRDHIAQDYPDRAARVVARLLSRIETLSELPHRGSIPRDELLQRKGYRFLTESSFLIFYKVMDSRVFIHRVIHGKRAYERLL
jgi:toxin ParE1/3/4